MSTESQLFEKAEKIYFGHSETRFIPAICAFKELLQNYPENVDGWLMMATMQSCIDDYDGALSSYDKAIECAPKNSRCIDQKLTTLSLLRHMEYSAPYFIDATKKRRHRIHAIPSPEELANTFIEAIDIYLSLEPKNKKTHKLLRDKATQLVILGREQEAIECYQNALEIIPEDEKKRFINPANVIHRNLSKLYYTNEKYDLALKHFELSEQGEELAPSQLFKAEIQMASEHTEQALQTVNDFIEYLDTKLKNKPEPAYFYQKIDALLWLKEFDRAREILSDFDVLKPFNKHLFEGISMVKGRIESAEEIYRNPQCVDRFRNLKFRKLNQQEAEYILIGDQNANELIAWYHEMGGDHTNEKLLVGIGKVIEAMKNNPEFPIAEYNNLRDVTDLLGICYGEILEKNFNWKWYYINEGQRGCVGYIIVSPDEKLSILTEEYFYTRIFSDNNEDYITLYEDLKRGIQFPWSDTEFIVLGNWKNPLTYAQIREELTSESEPEIKQTLFSRLFDRRKKDN